MKNQAGLISALYEASFSLFAFSMQAGVSAVLRLVDVSSGFWPSETFIFLFR